MPTLPVTVSTKRLAVPTSRFELNVFSPPMVKSPLSSAAILVTFDEKSFTLEERMFVRPEPSPEILVVVRAPTFALPWTSRVYAGEVVPMPTSPSA
jgi:hypothetical protein